MIYAYIRVSSDTQNLERQIKSMLDAGVEERNILSDKKSGKDFDRKSYNLLVGTDTTAPLLREGDLLIISSIDRLGRNYNEILEQWRKITKEIKADIRVLDMPLLDTSKGTDSLDGRFVSDLVLQILCYVAEKERLNIRERQAQGIAIAKAQGKHLGRPRREVPENFGEVYKRWRNNEITAVYAYSSLLKIPKATFYKMVKLFEEKNKVAL